MDCAWVICNDEEQFLKVKFKGMEGLDGGGRQEPFELSNM